MEFHERLQALRKQKGITQEELAQALYVSRTAVSKWESGRGYPNIDSLKAIAVYFSVTVDELLSCDEVLSIAQDEQKLKKSQMCDLIFGLLNLSAALLLVLPCFRQMAGDVLQAVSLADLTAVSSHTRVLYWLVVVLSVVVGLAILSLQRYHPQWWQCGKRLLSLAVHGVGVLLFILGTQPYAAALMFVFLTIQVVLLLKR